MDRSIYCLVSYLFPNFTETLIFIFFARSTKQMTVQLPSTLPPMMYTSFSLLPKSGSSLSANAMFVKGARAISVTSPGISNKWSQ